VPNVRQQLVQLEYVHPAGQNLATIVCSRNVVQIAVELYQVVAPLPVLQEPVKGMLRIPAAHGLVSQRTVVQVDIGVI
jgi:hypothetical protein